MFLLAFDWGITIDQLLDQDIENIYKMREYLQARAKGEQKAQKKASKSK